MNKDKQICLTEKYYTCKQAGQIFSCSTSTLKLWAQNGELDKKPATYLPSKRSDKNSFLLKFEDVRNVLEKNEEVNSFYHPKDDSEHSKISPEQKAKDLINKDKNTPSTLQAVLNDNDPINNTGSGDQAKKEKRKKVRKPPGIGATISCFKQLKPTAQYTALEAMKDIFKESLENG